MLAKAIVGARNSGQAITWQDQDGNEKNLTGATLSGVIQAAAGDTQAITGTLTLTDAANGVFSWTYGAADVAAAGEYLVQFKATFTTYDLTFATYWKIEEALPVTYFPFTYDPDTAVGQVRELIGDTDNSTDAGVKPTGGNFTDKQIQNALDRNGNDVRSTAAEMCDTLATMWAGASEVVKIRDYQISSVTKTIYYRQAAKQLRGSRSLIEVY